MIQVLYQEAGNTTAYLQPTNLKATTNIALNISSGISVTNWFTTNNSVNIFRNTTEGIYQNLETNYGKTSFQFNSINSFSLPHDYGIELSGYFNSSVLYGFFVMEKQYQLSFGIQKSLFKNKNGNIKFSVSDIFKNLTSGGSMHVNHIINTDFMNWWDSRRAALTFTYRFSKGNKASAPSASQNDEQNRIKK
jgi:hypothetical protein